MPSPALQRNSQSPSSAVYLSAASRRFLFASVQLARQRVAGCVRAGGDIIGKQVIKKVVTVLHFVLGGSSRICWCNGAVGRKDLNIITCTRATNVAQLLSW